MTTATTASRPRFSARVQSICMVAFNKSIADEMNGRLRNRRNLPARTEYQEAICRKVMARDTHVVVNALAGSGKTTTLEHICACFPGSSVQAKTLHSAGINALRYFLQRSHDIKDVNVDDRKVDTILSRLLNTDQLNADELARANTIKTVASRLVSLMKSYGFVAIRDAATDDDLMELCDRYDIELPEEIGTGEIFDMARNTLEENNRDVNTVDFDDMLYMPMLLKVTFYQNDLILIDESQDLNPIQIAMVRRMANGRGQCVFVGDRNQCQPAGTMVRLTEGTYLPIEKLKVGNEVTSFDRHSGVLVGRRNQGRKITAIQRRPFRGRMLMVQAAGKETMCTPEHKWVTRFVTRNADIWVTYLMRKGDWFRVGWCQLFNVHGINHLAQRARLEKAESAWILGVHSNKRDASLQESRIATIYGLPLVQFNQSCESGHYNNEFIEEFFDGLPTQLMKDRAANCLKDFGRSIDYPFYTVDLQQRQGRTTIFITQACNLIPKLMAIPVDMGDREPVWTPIEKNNHSDSTVPGHLAECDVWSLAVEGNETYIADGLVTHNCIYGFRGSDIRALDTIVDIFNAAELPLSTCWRCPTSVIQEAQRIVPEIEASPNAIEGSVNVVKQAEFFGTVQAGDFVLCRTTAPLVDCCMALIRSGKAATVRGRDIGQGLITLVNKISKRRNLKGKSLVDSLTKYRDEQMERLNHPSKETQRQSMSDKMDTLLILAEECGDFAELRRKIESIFSDADGGEKNLVLCSTAHKAKGLESENVFIIKPELMPFPYARKDWQIKQEHNLKYVAITRATRNLVFVETPGK